MVDVADHHVAITALEDLVLTHLQEMNATEGKEIVEIVEESGIVVVPGHPCPAENEIWVVVVIEVGEVVEGLQ